MYLMLERYFEDMEVLHENTMPYRSYYIPTDKQGKARFINLNGDDWQFKLFDNPFEIDEYNTSGYDTITVPSSWNMLGYDSHLYANTKGPIPFIPPYVPDENPTGVYIKQFTMDGESLKFKNYINFDGVDSCFYLWLNDKFIGYSQVSHATSEFDISDMLVEGINTMRVVVLKYCEGTFLEDQDKFRMSGIFRDVYIVQRPQKHVRDFTVRTALTDCFSVAEIEIDVEGNADYEIKLLDGDTVIYEGASPKFTVQNPKLWSAETPYLYTLNIICDDEIIPYKIGIKQVIIKDSVLYINGQNVKIKGVNRHDSNAYTGAAISREQLIADLNLMKEHNVNAIRTSHYPNSPWAYELYSEYGFYVMAEADLECHNTADLYGGGHLYNSKQQGGIDDYTFGMLCHDPNYYDAMLDRIKACVIREKNSPCIFMWSLGNESGYGPNLEKCAAWIKEFDPAALIHYESSVYQKVGYTNDLTNIDVYSRMYICPDTVAEYCDSNPAKPIVLCEYSHAMGNSNGDLERYYETMQRYDTYMGGFIWEWNDHAIYMGKDVNGKDKFFYGGDFKDFPNAGNFCLDGLIHPNRLPKTNLLEFKNVHRPIRAKFVEGKILLTNQQDFLNVDGNYVIRVFQLIDGTIVSSSVYENFDLPARETRELDFVAEDDHYHDDNYIMIKYYDMDNQIVGFDQLMLNKSEITIEQPTSNLHIEDMATKIIVSSDKMRIVFDKFKCAPETIVCNNISYLAKPMDYNIFRAPTDNDRKIIREWRAAGYDRTKVKRLDYKIDGNQIEFNFIITAVYLQAIMQVKAIYTINLDTIQVSISATKDPVFPELPRFGMRMYVDKSFQNVTYRAYGPYESYCDKHNLCYLDSFNTTVSEMYEDYIVPQEHGSRYGADFVKLMNSGNSVIVASDGFSFNVSNFTQEQLFKTPHNFKLVPEDFVTLCIDYKNAGIGSSSCGQAKLYEKYAIMEDEFKFDFVISLN